MKIDFIIAGTQKGGTTALTAFLQCHPQVHILKLKELHFFDNDDLFPDAIHAPYGLYYRNFQGAGPGQKLGECTPSYMYWKPAMERIHAIAPDIGQVEKLLGWDCSDWLVRTP